MPLKSLTITKELVNVMQGLDTPIEETTSASEIKALIEFLKELVTTLQASEKTAHVVTNVMYQLAETDPDTCRWVLDNLYDLEAYLKLVDNVVKLATKKLIVQGFIPGQDFSANHSGEILIKRKVKAVLMEEVAAFDRLLLEDIWQFLD